MRAPRLVVAILGAGGLLAAVVGEPAPSAAAPSAPERSSERVSPQPPDWDLEQIRDIFRFADGGVGSPSPTVAAEKTGQERPREAPPDPGPPTGPRLIGLIREHDGLKAALAVQGEVVVLGRGESALGFSVVDVDEEGVVVRGPGDDRLHLSLEPTGIER